VSILQSNTFQTLLKDTKQSFTRFFFVYVSMVVATLFILLDSHKIMETKEEYLFGFYLAIVLLTAIKLLVEDRGFSFVFHLVFMVFGLGVVFGSLEFFYSSIGFLSLGVFVFLMVSPFLSSNDNRAFLEFNLNFAFISLFALIASTILYLGIVGVIQSVVYLFGLELWDKVYSDIAIVVFTMVFPTIVISNISKPLLKSFVRPIEILIKYILTPLLLVYLVILYAYFIKVGITQELPKGSLSNMVSYYGIFGVFTFILIGAIESKNRVLELFERYFFHSLIIPLGFLYFAIYIRIEQYGFTESRYAILFIALWLTVLVGYFFLKKGKVLFKNIFLLLSGFLFIAYATPFSATKLSVDSQIDRFVKFLDTHSLLKDGEAIASKKELSLDERIDITSIVQYIQFNKSALKKVEPYFKTLKQEQNLEDVKWKLLEFLNIKPAYSSMKKPELKEYKNYKFSPSMARVYHNSYISNIHLFEKSRYNLFYFDNKGIKKDIVVSMKDSQLMVEIDKRSVVFNILSPLEGYKKDSINKEFFLVKNNIALKIQSLELRKNEITGMNFYLIIGE